uniref:E4 n=1 Tax=Human papillomavirus 38 TaxID=37959 RepID=R9QDM3_HPV38|nr:E4 [Human papillomavirus 38]
MMLSDMVSQDYGKYVLIKTLCLPPLPVLRRQLETPPTPHPGRHSQSLPPPCPPNGHDPKQHGDTEEKHLALQPPPAGKGKDKEKPHAPKGEEKADQGPEAPTGEGGTPGDPPPEDPQSPPSGEGEGEEGTAEGGGRSPARDQDPSREPLLQGVAYRLTKWERQFDQLVDQVVEDLRGYWQTLQTPQ